MSFNQNETLYAVQSLSSKELLFICNIYVLQGILRLHIEAVARVQREAESDKGCILHDTKLYGTVLVTIAGPAYRLLPNVK